MPDYENPLGSTPQLKDVPSAGQPSKNTLAIGLASVVIFFLISIVN